MHTLRIAFVAEGSRDLQVIPVLIERIIAEARPTPALQLILDAQRWDTRVRFVEAFTTIVAQAQLQADLLVCHVDADAANDQQVRQAKITPALARLEQDTVLRLPIVWAVPVQAVEAWLLADPTSFGQALGVGTKRFPAFPRDPERINRHEAKTLFDQTIRELLGQTQRQRRRIRPDLFATIIARDTALAELRRLPAFHNFEQQLLQKLTQLRFQFTK
ncbi:MAG: DUF4276 family protein [Candidatus Viridilinea halotolerans]|uniref:DUF4276 family protein n=1 Tax=Candidatus Viridilinea halotolerans TaxID=2491704 RepID=A0A426U0F7_9CHLR|nr:MAG: DUF4276 family protein [Candidatus Viridilinea halotolerans]